MINFLKRNWAVLILIFIGITLLKNNYSGSNYSVRTQMGSALPMSGGVQEDITLSSNNKVYNSSSIDMVVPTDNSERLIIQDTELSLQVKDVTDTIGKIEKTTREFGGVLISSNLSKPNGAASGHISVRVPEEKRKEAVAAYEGMAIKVVSESVNGTDITDRYVDLQARLEVLQKTKSKFEDILSKATAVSDLLNVQQQLISLQSQIDGINGQQKYYEQSAKLTKITIYLSTDELALPYAPTNEWRPMVIFKEAVRSLVGMIRAIGSVIIWTIVFLPIIIPIVLIIRYIKRRRIIKK